MRTFKSLKSLRSNVTSARFEDASDWVIRFNDGSQNTFLSSVLTLDDGILTATGVDLNNIVQHVHYWNIESVAYWAPLT